MISRILAIFAESYDPRVSALSAVSIKGHKSRIIYNRQSCSIARITALQISFVP